MLLNLSQLLKKNSGAWLCGFLVSTMTFWKTIIYLMQYFEFCAGGHMVAHLDWQQYLGLLLLPNAFWVFLPFYFMLAYGKILRAGLESRTYRKPKSQ